MRTIALALISLAWLAGVNVSAGEADGSPLVGIDLATPEGVAMVSGAWRYHDVRIIETQFRAPGADGQPSEDVIPAYDLEPHAGAAGYDDSAWDVIDPASLGQRRSAGRFAFNWYRIGITIPQRVGDIDPSGTDVIFETTLDDYAEIWVDGEISRAAGQSGGSVIKGWNAPNRLLVARHVRPGQRIQLAVFGANGPLSNPPTNYIYVRSAKLEFHRGSPEPVAVTPSEVNVEVERLDPRIDSIVPLNPKVFKLAEGFTFTEGPLWMRAGYLLFSDPNENRIYKYDPDAGVLGVYREHSGYSGADSAEYGQPGSNGLTVDGSGRLTIDEHGNHRVSRIEPDGKVTVLADNYRGRRLNSPNDLVYRSDGTLYFTDPPFGLPQFFEDPRKELEFSGIYLWRNGKLRLLARELTGPNGLAFSPDEKFLYVSNWDEKRKVVMRYPVHAGGALGQGLEFFNMNSAPGAEALDGLKVDNNGNLFVSGPGGVWVISADGTHLGTIRLPRLAANFAWGGPDGKSLYLTARSALYRMPLLVAGPIPGPVAHDDQ